MRKLRDVLYVLLLALPLTGCGGGPADDLPDLAAVSGTVTLDGQPLSDAMISFEPQASGALSSGTTDEAGRFILFYNPDTQGAVLGTHTVRISKREMEGGPDIIPPQYNDMSELTATVTSAEAEIDFPLVSKK